MKKTLMLLTASLIFQIGQAQFIKATLQASGLTCAMCSKAVKVALEEVAYVQKVGVDLKRQEYSITFKENADADFDALKNAVEDAGFSVASLKVTGNFSEMIVQKDQHIVIDGKNFHFLNGNNQLLKGETIITIVDKYFLSAKDFKKQSAVSKMECVQTGKTANCCSKEGISADARVFHVKI